jgi:hypothetical protein
MLLLFSGQIAAFIPGVLSFAVVILLLLAVWKVEGLRRNRLLCGLVLIVALFFVFAGILLLYISGFWYMLGSSPGVSYYVAT